MCTRELHGLLRASRQSTAHPPRLGSFKLDQLDSRNAVNLLCAPILSQFIFKFEGHWNKSDAGGFLYNERTEIGKKRGAGGRVCVCDVISE